MSLQWTFVAGFLYAEMFFCILFMLPFVSARRWYSVFKSGMIGRFAAGSAIYFSIFMGILVLLLIDAIREVSKYTGAEEVTMDKMVHTEIHMKLFRAQRNLYIVGFAIFLWLVLRRLVTLLCTQAQLDIEKEAALKQAASASDAAKKFLDGDSKSTSKRDAKSDSLVAEERDRALDELKSTKKELEQANSDMRRSRLDLDALKSQATQTNKTYDSLMKEHEKLQIKVAQLEASGDSKKDS